MAESSNPFNGNILRSYSTKRSIRSVLKVTHHSVVTDHNDGSTRTGQIHQRLADGGGRSCINAPRGLIDRQCHGFLHDFAANHEFLQIAAGQRTRRTSCAWRAHVKLFDHRFGEPACCAPVQKPGADKALAHAAG